MKSEVAGKQIKVLRKKKKMSRDKLCKGLCTVQNLFLIEEGEGLADMLLLVSLLERLGKSAERLTYILTAEEYHRLAQRDKIEEALRFGRLSEARDAFVEYQRENPPGKNRILHMYEERICGILALEEYVKEMGGDVAGQGGLEAAAAYFMAAMKWADTCEGQFDRAFIEELDAGEKFLSMFEVENILLYLYVQWLMGNKEGQMELLEALYRYLRKNIQDDELRAQHSAKIGMLLGARYLEKGDYNTCAELHEEILQLNRDNGMVVCLLPVMEQIVAAYKMLQETEKMEFYTVHKENLEGVFQEFNVSLDCINKLYYSCCLRQYFIEGEIIAAERKCKGISQEELIEGIYQNKENLSRVETGKANSDRKKFYQLMGRLGVDKTRYNGNLITDEFQLLSLERDIERHLARAQTEEVVRELRMLESSVDMKEKCNQQLVLGIKNKEMHRSGEIGIGEALERAKGLLELSYHLDNTEKGGERYRRIPFQNEMYLFNQVCILLRKDGRIGEAIEMMERMLRTYDAVKEDKKFHFRNVHLCAINLCRYLEMTNRLDEAEKVADMLIQEDLVNGKITQIQRVFASKFDVFEKRGLVMQEGKKYLQRAYLSGEWCGYKKDYERLKGIMERIYPKEPD